MSRTSRVSLLSLLAASLMLAACTTEGGVERDVDAVRARARAMALTVSTAPPDWTIAANEMAPLIGRANPDPLDLLRAALIEYHRFDDPRARELLDRASPSLPGNLQVAYLDALLLHRDLQYEKAAAAFEAMLEKDPSALAARIAYATALDDMDRAEAAVEQYEYIRSLGIEANASIYYTATHKLMLASRRATTEEEKAKLKALLAELPALDRRGLKAMKTTEVENSGYGAVPGPVLHTLPPGAPTAPNLPSLATAESLEGVTLPGREHLAAIDIDGDGNRDVLAWGPGGASVVLRDADVWVSHVVSDESVVHMTAADLDESAEKDFNHPHPALEVLMIGADGTARVVTFDNSNFVPLGPGPLDATDVADGVFVDHDHDGDTDIALATSTGVVFLRNDGTVEQVDRTLVAAPVDVAALGPLTDITIEDLDGDEDVDIIALAADGSVRTLSNERRHRWRDVSQAWRTNTVRARSGGLFLADIDKDGVTDWLTVADDSSLAWHRGLGAGVGEREPIDTNGVTLGTPQLVDVDANTHLDLVEDGQVLAGPLVRRNATITATPWGAPRSTAADLDNDSTLDLVQLADDGTLSLAKGSGGWNAITLILDGRKDNRTGIGTLVEVYTGLNYQRIYARGDALTIGLGNHTTPDAARLFWPNGVPQRLIDLDPTKPLLIEQTEGPAGSCPFLYTWNGETFVFITDVLGTTPLGLPFSPDMQVPFDHEEYVLVKGHQLVPRDGRLDIAITEELREVTYLDQLRLHAIDHPADVEIQPNEGFVFPPFPPHHVHTLSDVHGPALAVSGDGIDITELVTTEDDRYGAVFERELTQYYGLTKPWSLELDFSNIDTNTLRDATSLRLAITGWFWWADASVNMAAARHPTISFDVPMLWVPDETAPDGWRPAGPPIGFPAGKTKTQMVDVTDILVRDDPRLKITSTLALSYDALRLAVDADDAPFVDTALMPITADVTWRGFSKPFRGTDGGPEVFDWDELDNARWDQHPGTYTRYGDVIPVLDSVDNQTVIFGAGDVVYASFDAAALPELPEGWTRSYLIYFNGWAKDRDPNTHAAERVEPLPFHGMTTYPPERPYPSSPEIDAWRETYNTRPARVLRHSHPDVEAAMMKLPEIVTVDE